MNIPRNSPTVWRRDGFDRRQQERMVDVCGVGGGAHVVERAAQPAAPVPRRRPPLLRQASERYPASSSTRSPRDPDHRSGRRGDRREGQIRTDLDGRFSVKVPAGTYRSRFFAPLYQGARLEKVVVQPNKTATADVPLKPEGKAGVEVVEVVAQARRPPRRRSSSSARRRRS